MLTGSWSDDIQFAGFVEGNFGNSRAKQDGKDKFGLNYQKSRAQYFQVHAIDNGLMLELAYPQTSYTKMDLQAC